MQVTFGMGIGGMERVIMDLCRYTNPGRFRFSICCLNVRGPLADQIESEGVPVIYCSQQSRIRKYLRWAELSEIFRRENVQIIHTHHTPAFVDSVLGRQLARIPILINTDHCKQYPVPKRWALLEKTASYFADEIVAVSNHTREDLIRHEGLSSRKISVLYNGTNLKLTRKESAHELKNELGIGSGDYVIGTVARLDWQKGLDLLLRAIPILKGRFHQFKVVIVGGGKQDLELKSLASDLGIADHVLFLGWRTDAIDLIQTFDTFVLSSNFEGMPMVLLEAMALGKPIVAAAVGGVPEVVQDGFNGFLLNERNADMLGELISRLVNDPALAKKFGANGRNRYEELFTAENMASKYEALYEKWISKKEIG